MSELADEDLKANIINMFKYLKGNTVTINVPVGEISAEKWKPLKKKKDILELKSTSEFEKFIELP